MKREGQAGTRSGAGKKGAGGSSSRLSRAALSSRARRSEISSGALRTQPKKLPPREEQPRGLARLFRQRVLEKLIVIVVVLAAGGGLGAGAKAAWNWLLLTPRLAIRELKIKTGPRVSEAEVRMLANLREGDNILGFRLADCVQAIQIHPWVKRASVMRELPDRVVIEVQERRPAALIALGALYYVDEDGEVFKKALPGDDLNYPVLSGIGLREEVEDKAEADRLIQLGLKLAKLAQGSRMFPLSEVSEIYLDRAEGATVVRTEDGMRIRFGQDKFEDKWSRLEQTLVKLRDEAPKVAELDLNFEGRATIRLREGYRVASEQGPPGAE
jgi:cell division protein FtsQ